MNERSILRRPGVVFLLMALTVTATVPISVADETPSPAAALLRLLQSGRIPQERLGPIIQLTCRRGNADDLAYIYRQSIDPQGFGRAARLTALEALAEAALTRKVKPSGSLDELGAMLTAEGALDEMKTHLAAIRLAGIWQVESAAPQLQKIALADASGDSLRGAAIDALVKLGGPKSRTAFVQLTAADRPLRLRYLGVAALARLDTAGAAPQAAAILAEGADSQLGELEDPAPLLDAFLEARGGPEELATAIADKKPPADVAKIALRYMYSIGRTDPELVAVLSEAAGISTQVEPLSKGEIQQLVAEVLTKGDAARGEEVFRREDLNCMKCHSVSKGGGDVGPDLSPVGASSPPDYLIKSILFPNQAVKEAYLTHVIFTLDGKIYQGIVVDKDDRRVIIKEAAGLERMIPIADIDEMAEGRSLMPQGLTKFLTHGELVDLVRFLSELGKPGPLGIRSKPTMQRWRVLAAVAEELSQEVPDFVTFSEHVLGADPLAWRPAYAKVAGMLPLAPLAAKVDGKVIYLRGEIDVSEAGRVGVAIDSPAETFAWIDDEPFGAADRIEAELSRGVHQVTLRVVVDEAQDLQLKLELFKVDDSEAEFAVVDGR